MKLCGVRHPFVCPDLQQDETPPFNPPARATLSPHVARRGVLDVSRFAGAFEHVFETVTAGVTLQSPQLDINTVAAGGGSRLFFRSGLFAVG